MINQRIKGAAAAFSAKAGGAGLVFLSNIMLARILGTSGTGVYFLSITIVSIGVTIASLGLNNAVLRFASIAYAQKKSATLAVLFRKSTALIIVAGGTIGIVFWLIIPILPFNMAKSGELQVVLPVMLIAIAPLSLIQIQGEFFKAMGKPGKSTVVQAVILPMFMVTGLAVFRWFGGASVHEVALLYTIAAITAVLFSGLMLLRDVPGIFREQCSFDTRMLLRTSLPLLWVASMNLIMGWTDILFLGIWTDSATVGVYGIATRTASLTGFILIAINSVITPQFAVLYNEKKLDELERVTQVGAMWMLLIALPVILFLLLFPKQLLHLFGTGFVQGAPFLRILVIGQLINVATGSVGYLLMMTGHERLMRNNIMLSALINLTGNFFLIPKYGAAGAALSTAFSLAFMNLFSFYLVYKKLNINTLGYLKGVIPCSRR
ncbi:MAG: flippase [Deltaproteobacteria bacterium]|nr:flippase [Deltaproteobacteria bacterium]